MEITDNDIKIAASIFLQENQSFNEEQIDFIKFIDRSLHLQACPGSGKTTALLAKIYLLSEQIPFENNKGICVLTHTNVAIDLIKAKLGEKANKILSYPNFFGTIQSFVDRYLAIPAYINCFDYRPKYIDNEFFLNKLSRFNNILKNNYWLKKNKGQYNTVVDYVFNIEVEFKENCDINLKLKLKKDTDTYRKIQEIFLDIYKEGYLRFNDAYNLSLYYLKNFLKINSIFSSRFKYVFIDEAQDTSQIQKEIIEKCFNENTIIQWIGDTNQAIMNDNYTEPAWNPVQDSKYDKLELTVSNRLSQPIANIVKNVAVKPYNNLTGNNTSNLKPILIVFNDQNIGQVIDKYTDILLNTKTQFQGQERSIYEISLITGNPIKAVGWVGKEKNNGLSIKSYYQPFDKKNTGKNKLYFHNLYTMCQLSKNISPKDFKKKTISCITEALSLSGILNSKNHKYSNFQFLSALKEKSEADYINLLTSIAKYLRVYDFKNFSTTISQVLQKHFNLTHDNEYLTEKELKDVYQNLSEENFNTFKKSINGNEIQILIDTVHGVKGETHTATLYLETNFHKNSIKYFINKLVHDNEQKSKNNSQDREEKATRIAHVAFSRPTHLLCIAIHTNEYEQIKDNLNNLFKVYEI